MYRLFPAIEFASIGTKLFVAAGAGEIESRIATESLLTSSLLVEILGSALAGISSQDKEVFGNGLCFLVIDPSAFCRLDEFRRRMDETVAYVKSSRPAPGFDEILVPGELEFRTLRQRAQDGIPVDDVTLAAMKDHAERLRVDFNVRRPAEKADE